VHADEFLRWPNPSFSRKKRTLIATQIMANALVELPAVPVSVLAEPNGLNAEKAENLGVF
jgi:hypothetical protein